MPAQSTPLILVADDDSAVLDIVQYMLEREGWRVLRAEDGVQCVDLFQQNIGQVDLVIADAAMPQMDGIRVSRLIRALNAYLCMANS